MSDNVIDPDEEIEIDALALRTRTLAPLSQGEMDAYIVQFREILDRQNSVYALTDLACEKLNKADGAAEAIFAHCADVAFADRTLVEDEIVFLEHVATALKIETAMRQRIMQVMLWKNAY